MSPEVNPLDRMIQIHEGFVHHCKMYRLQVRLPNHPQNSIEESVAKEYGYEKHGNFWIQMEKNRVKKESEDGLMHDEIELVMPEYAKEAATMLSPKTE